MAIQRKKAPAKKAKTGTRSKARATVSSRRVSVSKAAAGRPTGMRGKVSSKIKARRSA